MAEQATSLSYAVRLRVLLKYFGQFCLLIACLTAVPLGVSLLHGETSVALRYCLVILVLATLGLVFVRLRPPRTIQVNETMALTAFLFLFTPLLMTYPLTGAGIGFVDALFEAVSAVTTTGLTTISDVSRFPPYFIFARAWMQWYGGLGIVVLSLALLIRSGLIAKGFAEVEDMEDNLAGGMRAYSRRVLLVYASLTVTGIAVLWMVGVHPFQAILYALASVSTGGFSPHDNSAAGLSWPAQAAVILISLSGSLPLVFYYGFHRKKHQKNTNILQIKTVLICGGLATLFLGLWLWLVNKTGALQTFRHAFFMAFSAQTTTGFSTLETVGLDDVSKLILMLAMGIGGSVGSTSGGIKVFRFLIFLQCIHLMVLRTRLTPHAVVKPRLGGQAIGETDIGEALTVILLFFGVIVFSWLPFVIWGFDPVDALFEVVSATGTVGLSAGITQAGLPAGLKSVLCIDMLLGRLEIVAWLVLISPSTWVGRRL